MNSAGCHVLRTDQSFSLRSWCDSAGFVHGGPRAGPGRDGEPAQTSSAMSVSTRALISSRIARTASAD